MCDYEKESLLANQQESAGMAMKIGPVRSDSPLREAQYEVKHLEERLRNRKRGLDFLAKHPEFAEFLELQRSGCL